MQNNKVSGELLKDLKALVKKIRKNKQTKKSYAKNYHNLLQNIIKFLKKLKIATASPQIFHPVPTKSRGKSSFAVCLRGMTGLVVLRPESKYIARTSIHASKWLPSSLVFLNWVGPSLWALSNCCDDRFTVGKKEVVSPADGSMPLSQSQKSPPQISRPVAFNPVVQGHCNSIASLISGGNESLVWKGKHSAAGRSQRAQLMSRQQLWTVATSLPTLCLHAHRKICHYICISLTLAKVWSQVIVYLFYC